MSMELPTGFEDHSIALLSDLIAIPSPTGAEEDAAAAIAARLRSHPGIDVVTIPPANVVATLAGGQDGPKRLFATHTDTMTPAVMSSPHAAVRLDGKPFGVQGEVIRGLGAAAPKSAVAAMVTALVGIADRRDQLEGSITLAAVTKDLEADHAGIKETVAEMPLEADWAVVSEPSGNRLVVGARGIAHVRIQFSGMAAHCGQPDRAVNPLFAVAEMLERIRRSELPQDPLLGPATLVPFDVGGDASPPKSPEHAWLVVDRRTLPSEDTESVLEGLRATAAEVCQADARLSSSVSVLKAMHPFSIPAEAELVKAARGSIAEAIGADPGTTSIAFSSNAGYIAHVLGIPSIGYGPGEITALGPDEHVPVAQVVEATRGYFAMMAMTLG